MCLINEIFFSLVVLVRFDGSPLSVESKIWWFLRWQYSVCRGVAVKSSETAFCRCFSSSDPNAVMTFPRTSSWSHLLESAMTVVSAKGVKEIYTVSTGTDMPNFYVR